MGYRPWYAKVADRVHELSKRAIRHLNPGPDNEAHNSHHTQPPSDSAELERQLKWDKKYHGGKTAPREEQIEENQRRMVHEQILFPDQVQNPDGSLNTGALNTLRLSFRPENSNSSPSATNDPSRPARHITTIDNPTTAGTTTAEIEPGDGVDPTNAFVTVDAYIPAFGEAEARGWRRN